MLYFDFQIQHPVTKMVLFQMDSLSPRLMEENKGADFLAFNKLVCQSTLYPFNSMIVNFKWSFFRD
jgi:hypothetical protein